MFAFDIAGVGLSLVVTLVIFTGLWLISLRYNDVSIVDYYWATGFAVTGWICLLRQTNISYFAFIFMLAVTLWAVRLTAHLVIRHLRSPTEDARYTKMRLNGGSGFKRNSLFYIFWLQGVVQFVIALPVLVVTARPVNILLEQSYAALFNIGLGLFLIGFLVEAVADFQLMRFKSEPLNKGRLLRTGLFSLCRHPNYLGEIMLWWGLAICAYELSNWYCVFISPVLLTFLLMKVSGVTMLDTHLSERAGFKEWQAMTPALIPRLRRIKA